MHLKHVAIIMDGNGRWAKQRKRPRTFGHQKGARSVRSIIEASVALEIKHLTLFAFSSENWSRPEKEVAKLMQLFMRSLKQETPELQKQGVQMSFIGDLEKFSPELQASMQTASEKISTEQRLRLNIAVNYGGQWDMTHACQKICEQVMSGKVRPEHINQTLFRQYTALGDQPEVDLLIRTGGESRISNFLLWDIAYAELFFTMTLWPDFNKEEYAQIIHSFTQRERRFGQTSEQFNA